MVPLKRAVAYLLISLLAGCNYPTTPPAPTVDIVGTAVAGTLAAEAIATEAAVSPAPESQLPHSVYFLSESSGISQVWRLERDGFTQAQVTDKEVHVDGFDVSRVDGSVAFVTSNQLYMVNGDGSNRRLLVNNATADPEEPDYFYREKISDPRFSPDGRYLAYAYDGLWIVDLASNEAVHLIQNQLDETDDGIFPDAFYAPLAWGPNSEQLLLTVGGFESSTLAIFNTGGDSSVIELESNSSIVCCQVAWAPDNETILVANPFIGLIEPGLWRFDATSGEQTELLAVNEEGMFQFVGWPLELADGSLHYFYTSSTEIPTGDLPLFMMSSDEDGVSKRVELRPDSFSNISEVLWAEDGSLALIAQVNPSTGTSNGSVVLAFSDGRQLQVLLNDVRQLRWGE